MLSTTMELKTIFLILHLFGVAIGAGSAFIGDFFFFMSAKDRKFSLEETKFLHIIGLLTWIGLFILFVSGLGIFLLDTTKYLNSTKFLAKVVIVCIIAINGLFLHITHMPKIRKVIGLHFPTSKEFRDNSRVLLISGAVSIISWSATIILGTLKSVPLTVAQILGIYLLALITAIIIAQISRKKILGF
jgi:hypothetical protein